VGVLGEGCFPLPTVSSEFPDVLLLNIREMESNMLELGEVAMIDPATMAS
jgi:hypothetical protein